MVQENTVNFRTRLLAFFREHGYSDPVGHLAYAGHVSRSRIYAYLRRLELKADPKIIKWLAFEVDQLRRPFEQNIVLEYFVDKLNLKDQTNGGK